MQRDFMKTFDISLIAPTMRQDLTKVSEVVLPGISGALGVLADHSTMTVGLKSGVINIVSQRFFITAGIADINHNFVHIIVDTFSLVSELDPVLIKQELDSCEKILLEISLMHERHAMQKKIDILQHKIDVLKKK